MSNFKTVLIEDSRIMDLTDELSFGVKSSASQSTYQQFSAISTSNNALNFNIQIPSESIVIDREIYLQASVLITLKLGNAPENDVVFAWGQSESWQSFPLNKLFTTTQCTINNTSVSENTQDIIDVLLRMYDKKTLGKFNSMTPAMPDDAYALYADAVGATNNPLASYNTNGYDLNLNNRGCFPTNVVIRHYIDGVYTDASVVSTGLTDTWEIEVSATFTEPFVALSPWLNCQPNMRSGLLGVNNMSMVLNISNNLSRVISTAHQSYNEGLSNSLAPSYITSISLGSATQPVGISNARLLFNFLTLTDEQYGKVNTKNICPYATYPRFLSTSASQNAIQPKATATLTSQSIQLNQISDKIFVAVRIPMSQQNVACSASFLGITGVQITFNNASGLLATASQQDLYTKISYANGSQQNFLEFSGKAVNNNPVSGNVIDIPTTGGFLVLDPVKDFSLPSFLSASSLGQFQFQFNVSVYNQYPFPVVPEILIITMNSGLFITDRGQSTIFTGLLTKETVMTTKAENPVPHISSGEYARIVGGNNGNASMGGFSLKKMHHRQESKVAGASSGGVMSAGRLGRHLR